MKPEKKTAVKKAVEPTSKEEANPNAKGLIKVQFPNGKIHEYMPLLAKKLVDKQAAQYI